MEQEKYQEMHGSESASEVESPYAGKGLSMGKMILMAGLVFSSAPVVVPGILVVSAIGLACSVPYGLFLATYSFTETLMTKLLPLRTLTRPDDGDESMSMFGQKKPNEDEIAEEDGYGDDDEEARSVVVEGEGGQEKDGKDEAEALKNEDKTADAPSAETEHGTTGSSEDAAVSQAVAESEGGGDANQDDADTASTEVGTDKEKQIWEQIDGLRTIIGYSGSRRSTYLEELAALYVFAGVEPPAAASVSDPRDLVVYLNTMLGDLKLIVGVK